MKWTLLSRSKLTVTLIILFNIFSLQLFASTDLTLRNIINNNISPSVSVSQNFVVKDKKVFIPVIINTLDSIATIDAISGAGGNAVKITSDIVSANIPRESIETISLRNEVVFMEAATRLTSKMNSARSYSAIAAVQTGSVDGVNYNGQNVVVGVIDDALDYGDPDFQNTAGTTRLQYIQQTIGSTTYECVKGQINAGSCGIEDGGQGTFHGTHVTGIAAGSNSTYTGGAPSADIMFVFNSSSDPDPDGSTASSFGTDVLAAATKIFEKADVLDKASVINISLGTSLGAHDGTSLLESGLSTLSATKPGRIIINAAGNEQAIPESFAVGTRDYVGGIHATINVTDGTSEGMRLAIWNGSTVSLYGGMIADVWLDTGTKDYCNVAVFGYTNGRSTPDFTFPSLTTTDVATLYSADVPFSTDTASAVTAEGNGVKASITIDSSDARNNKPHGHVLLDRATSGTTSSLESMWFDVVIRASGGNCAGNIWLYPDYTSYNDFLKGMTGQAFSTLTTSAKGATYTLSDGDSLYTTTIPATATGVIAAGSFMPPKPYGAAASEWTGDNGVTYDQSDINAPGGSGSITNDLSSFSSLGPTADGRTKPEIVAPGEPIISTKARDTSMSSSIVVGGSHVKEAGTSMSSPHVAGLVALLLQRNNTLGVSAVKTALAQGAATDGMTSKTADPQNSYGAGKVNATSILSSVSADTSYYSGTGDLPWSDDSGSSSCEISRLKQQDIRQILVFLLFTIAPILVFLCLKRSIKV